MHGPSKTNTRFSHFAAMKGSVLVGHRPNSCQIYRCAWSDVLPMVKQFWSWRYAKFAHRCSKFPADMLPPVTPKPQACQTRVKFVNRAKPVVHVVWCQQCDFFSLSFGCLLACLLVCLLFVCVSVYVLWFVGYCFMLFSFCSWLLFSLLIKQVGNAYQ